MRRYVLTSLAIGILVILVILVLYFLKAFEPMTRWLSALYASKGFFRGETVSRLVWLEIGTIIVASLGVTWCVVDSSQLMQKLLVFFTSGLVIFGISPTMALYGHLFEPFSSLLAVLLAATSGLIFAGTEKGMRKRVLENVLGVRVSHGTFNELMSEPDPPDFSGAVRDVTVVTCRVFNHAELRGKLESAELLKMTNLFLRNTANFLMSRGAYLDESGPELVRVFFGMLRPGEDHVEMACRAALELRNRLKSLNQECETRWFQTLQYGVGISSGPMTVGVYGSKNHYFFSGIGSEIDFSRRLSHANVAYDSDVLLSAASYQMTHDSIEVRPMEMFYDPQEGVMTEIYQLLAMKEDFSEADAERRDLFWRGLILYREGKYEEALDHFTRSQAPGYDDGPIKYFIGKSQQGLADPTSVGEDAHREMIEEGHARLLESM